MKNNDDFIRWILFRASYEESKNIIINTNIDINIIDDEGRNSLFYADYKKSKLLIEYGINVNQIDIDGNNALYRANYNKSLLLLKKGINVNNINRDGENALFFSDYKTSILLIDYGIDINQTNIYGCNSLFFCSNNKGELLIRKGINTKQKHIFFKETALDYFYANKNNKQEINMKNINKNKKLLEISSNWMVDDDNESSQKYLSTKRTKNKP